jgi:acyl-CoA thioester hydrolase
LPTDAETAGASRPAVDAARLLRASYPFSIPIRMLWGDVDMLGHVNNVALGRCLEEARVAMFREMFAGTSAFDGSARLMLASLSVTYLAETLYPGEVEVAACVASVGRSSLRELAAIFQNGRCTVLADAVVVHATRDGPQPIGEDARGRVAGFGFRG